LDLGRVAEVNEMTADIKEYQEKFEKLCSVDARLQITRKRFQLQTLRKRGFGNTTNEVV
jgi:hypothetical protein